MSEKFKSSPIFGWLVAGTDLFTSQIEDAAKTLNKKLDDTHAALDSLQIKGEEVEDNLKRKFNPFSVVDNAYELIKSSAFFSVLCGGKTRAKKEQQLDLLSAKVDLLVEQVALLAAKRAAEAEKTSKTTARSPRTRKRTSASAAKADTGKAKAGGEDKKVVRRSPRSPAKKSTQTRSEDNKKAE